MSSFASVFFCVVFSGLLLGSVGIAQTSSKGNSTAGGGGSTSGTTEANNSKQSDYQSNLQLEQQCVTYQSSCSDSCQEAMKNCADADGGTFKDSDVASGTLSLSGGGSMQMVDYRSNCMSGTDVASARDKIASEMTKLNSDIDKEQDKSYQSQQDFIQKSADISKQMSETQDKYNEKQNELIDAQQKQAMDKIKSDANINQQISSLIQQESKARQDIINEQATVSQAMRDMTTSLQYNVEECKARITGNIGSFKMKTQFSSTQSLIIQAQTSAGLKSSVNDCYKIAAQKARDMVRQAQEALKASQSAIAGYQSQEQSLRKQLALSNVQTATNAQRNTANLAIAKTSELQNLTSLQSQLQTGQALQTQHLMQLSQQTVQNQGLLSQYSNQLSSLSSSGTASGGSLPAGQDYQKLLSGKAACDTLSYNGITIPTKGSQ